MKIRPRNQEGYGMPFNKAPNEGIESVRVREENFIVEKSNRGYIAKLDKGSGEVLASVGTGFEMKISFTLLCTVNNGGNYPWDLVDERINDVILLNKEHYSDIKVESLDVKDDDHRRDIGLVTVNMSMKWNGADSKRFEPFRIV